jgi:hypothetical protein
MQFPTYTYLRIKTLPRESHEHAREMSDNKDQQLAVYTKELQDQQDVLRQRGQELHHGHLKTLNAEHEAAMEGKVTIRNCKTSIEIC